MKVPFADIKLNPKCKEHVYECLSNNQLTLGKKTEQLERRWSEVNGHKYTVGVNSGTSACIAACLSLYSLGAKPGDEIITPGLSFIATSNAIRAAGFTPVWCDVKKETLNIDESLIEEKVNDKTAAIMPVSLIGKPSKVDVIRSICDEHNLYMIVDNCEGHGCKLHNKVMEEYADITTYSCYAAHCLFAVEFGFCTTNREDLRDILYSVRSHGRRPYSLDFVHENFGLNLKPTDIHASIGLGSLEEYKSVIELRRNNVEYFKSELDNLHEYCYFSEEDDDEFCSPHAFSLTFKENSRYDMGLFRKWMQLNEIEAKINFGAIPDHGCFAYMKQKDCCPNATYIGKNGVHWSVNQNLHNNQLDHVVDIVQRFFQ